jgi:HAD superfamily hydrolase (TIGR01509 family)
VPGGPAVLFDLDGVIVDSREHHLAAWMAFAREYAPTAPADYFHRTFGLRNDAIIGGLLEGIDRKTLATLAARKEELFRSAARGNLVLLPGVHELLAFLDDQSVPRAIVTSTPRANLDMVLESLGISHSFGALVAEEDAVKGKPDPEGFLVAARRLRAEPSNCVVIEDAPAGLQAAKSAGMRAIGVTTTHSAPDLVDADLVVASLSEEIVRTFLFQ